MRRKERSHLILSVFSGCLIDLSWDSWLIFLGLPDWSDWSLPLLASKHPFPLIFTNANSVPLLFLKEVLFGRRCTIGSMGDLLVSWVVQNKLWMERLFAEKSQDREYTEVRPTRASTSTRVSALSSTRVSARTSVALRPLEPPPLLDSDLSPADIRDTLTFCFFSLSPVIQQSLQNTSTVSNLQGGFF